MMPDITSFVQANRLVVQLKTKLVLRPRPFRARWVGFGAAVLVDVFVGNGGWYGGGMFIVCHCRLWVYFDCQNVSSFYTILLAVNLGSRSVHPGGHYSLFDSGHQIAMVTAICSKCLLLY